MSVNFQEAVISEKTSELTSETLRADFVFEVKKNSQTEIWHIEEQTQEDKNMLERMLKYFALLYDKYKTPVYQVVLYVGDDRTITSKMQNKAKVGFFVFQYELINLSQIPYKDFLETPETLPFAILGKYKPENLPEVLKNIGKKSKNFLRTRAEFVNLIDALLILSKKRNIENQVKNLISTFMPIDIDYKDTETFKEGKMEGIKEGKIETAKALLILGKNSLQEIAQATGLPLEQIQKLAKEIKKK